MAEVDRESDLARIAAEEAAVKAAEERDRIAAMEKQMQQARARLILDQKRDK